MKTLAKRLEQAVKHAVKHAGITAYRLATDTQTDAGTISRTLKGDAIRHEHTTLGAWAKRCGVRMEWLSTGAGPMVEGAMPQLRERPEWATVVADVRALHPELTQEDVELIGEMFDHPKIWPGLLDVAAVAAYAGIQRDWRARVAARGRTK